MNKLVYSLDGLSGTPLFHIMKRKYIYSPYFFDNKWFPLYEGSSEKLIILTYK